MAFTISDTTYAGEAASGFIVKAMTGFETVQGGHVYVKDGIKKSFTIPRFSVANMVQNRQATPTSQGTATVSKQVLTPKDWMIYMEFNPRDFEDHWQAVNLNKELLDTELPNEVASVIIQEVLKLNSSYLETAFWQSSIGGTAPYDKFDGMVTKLAASADVIEIPSGSYAALTNSNIDSKLALVTAAIATSVSGLQYDPNMKIFMNRKSFGLYAEWQKAQTYKGVDATQRGIDMFDGYKVVALPGIPDNTIIAAKGTAGLDSNLWIGMNSTSDDSYLQVAKLQANSELFFIKGLMKTDVQFGWGEEVVLYHSSNA